MTVAAAVWLALGVAALIAAAAYLTRHDHRSH